MTQPHPKRRRVALIAPLTIAITAVLAGIGVLTAWQLGWTIADNTAEAALSPETQIECTAIRREFQAWDRDVPRLQTMVSTSNPRDVVRYEINALRDDGQAFLKAATDYPDQPSKELAAAIAGYNVELGMVSLQHQLTGGTFEEPQRQKAIQAAITVEAAYKTFAKQTCGQAS